MTHGDSLPNLTVVKRFATLHADRRRHYVGAANTWGGQRPCTECGCLHQAPGLGGVAEEPVGESRLFYAPEEAVIATSHRRCGS